VRDSISQSVSQPFMLKVTRYSKSLYGVIGKVRSDDDDDDDDDNNNNNVIVIFKWKCCPCVSLKI
jgi:hypothetical protein